MISEKENMIAGEFYNASNEELIGERDNARNLTFDFNNTRPTEKEKRNKILKRLIKAKGSVYIEAPFNCDYGYNIEVGENFFANFGCTILDVCKVKIGDNVTIGAGSVVTKDIPDNVVAAGNPCRVIRNI